MTLQQRRIGQLVGQGLPNAEIAERLSLEISTVKSHVSRMLQRLNLASRQQLIAHLWRTGFMASSGPETEGQPRSTA
jgi:DNA-binding NarL/FixJ family response regulator